MEMGAHKVDSNFQAMFTLVLTSFNSMLQQLALGPFYVLFAIQKIVVCQTDGIVALVADTGFKITIGIPEIQVFYCLVHSSTDYYYYYYSDTLTVMMIMIMIIVASISSSSSSLISRPLLHAGMT